jgi:CDP-glucose 4,6-dehydratase
VLLTGHTGFKGAWTCLLLRHLSAAVFGIALPEETPSLFAQAQVRGLLAGERLVDLADERAVAEFVGAVKPDIVIHFAAQALVRDCYRRPREAFATNVMGTANLLEAVRRTGGVDVVLTATTDKVYFNAEQGRAFREGDRLGGIEPYSASKAGAEMVVAAYRGSYLTPQGIATPVCRAGNVIGGGDWSAERLLPDIVRSVQSGTILDVRNPGAVRPWQSVLDALAGYLLLVQHASSAMKRSPPLRDAEPEHFAFNFGPESGEAEVDVGTICRIVEDYWPERFRWRATPDRERIAESRYLALDPSRARDVLGWVTQHTPEKAIRQTLEWYDRFLKGHDAAELCERQIEEHFSRVT